MNAMGKVRAALGAALLGAAVGAPAAPVTGQGTWYGTNGMDGTLRGRDAAGNPVNLLSSMSPTPTLNPAVKYVYDVTLNLTWLADWNAGAGSSFDDGISTTDGRMTWTKAKSWAAGLADFGGGWRLPITDAGPNSGCSLNFDPGGGFALQYYGYNCTGSEMGHMYYTTLGNTSSGLTNTGPFSNMKSGVYWSGTAYAPYSIDAWDFNFSYGYQNVGAPSFQSYVVAVRPGDVLRDGGSVLEPQSLVLALTALAGLGAALRRRRAA